MISDKPCPRCGCYLIKEFKCNCGAVHDNHCVNCGRWASLPPTEHVELGPTDARCDAGPVEHEHSVAEKRARIRRFFEKAVQG